MSYIDANFNRGMDNLCLVQECIEEALGCKLFILDKNAGHIDALLDRQASIDALAVMPSNSLRSIAFRIQQGQNWATFTIRSKRVTGNDTELQKYDPSGSTVQPTHFVQVYVGDGVIHLGTAKYSTLMDYVRENFDDLDTRKAGSEGNEFKVVEWGNKEWIKTKTIECDRCKRA